MIVFTLDALADDSHRRHFIDQSNFLKRFRESPNFSDKDWLNRKLTGWYPNWQAYYDECDKDNPIEPVIGIWNDQISLGMMGNHQIWCDRPEYVREITEQWLDKNLLCFEPGQLKMRPIGDERSQEQLFEEWLNEECADMILAEIKQRPAVEHHVEMVFSSHKPTIEMFRKRGVFVFDCNQGEMNEVELL